MANDHGPISPEYHQQMNDLAKGLDKFFNGEVAPQDRKHGFMLLVFPFNDGGGRINYISNCERESAHTAMKEFIARSEGMNMPDTGVVQ